jgi:transposase
MREFLDQVQAAHPDECIVMVVAAASSHVSKDLIVPEHIRRLRLPPYAPQFNPQEYIWDELREKEFPNRVFADLASVTHRLQVGLPRLANDSTCLRSISAWPWVINLNLNAN